DCIEALSPNATFIWPDDKNAYDSARIGANLRYDRGWPTVVVSVTSESDIVARVWCASRQQAPVAIAVMNGGHSFEGLRTADDQITPPSKPTPALQLSLDRYSHVLAFDRHKHGDAATITIQAGMRLGRLYGNIIQLGGGSLVFGGGTCAEVGVAGHVLCGGYG